jgi:hypothetical protein
MLRVVRNTLGQVVAVELNLGESPLWVPLPWNLASRKFEPQSERDDEWLAIAQSLTEWQDLDLEDQQIVPAPPAPDWEGFRVRCAIAALPITGHSAKTSALNSLLTVLLSRIDKEPEILPQVAQIWDSMCAIAKPSANVVQLINGLCQACNMVFRLDSAGNMIDLQGRLI